MQAVESAVVAFAQTPAPHRQTRSRKQPKTRTHAAYSTKNAADPDFANFGMSAGTVGGIECPNLQKRADKVSGPIRRNGNLPGRGSGYPYPYQQ